MTPFSPNKISKRTTSGKPAHHLDLERLFLDFKDGLYMIKQAHN
jgi:hypothetical protein